MSTRPATGQVGEGAHIPDARLGLRPQKQQWENGGSVGRHGPWRREEVGRTSFKVQNKRTYAAGSLGYNPMHPEGQHS